MHLFLVPRSLFRPFLRNGLELVSFFCLFCRVIVLFSYYYNRLAFPGSFDFYSFFFVLFRKYGNVFL